VIAALLTGCRDGELGRLECQDFNRDAGTLTIRQSKAGKPRHIPLDAEAQEFLTGCTAGRPPSQRVFLRKDGRPWGKSHQLRPMERACQAGRIDPPIGFHILRHTWASHRVMKGAPLIVVADVLGHSDTQILGWLRSTMGTSARTTSARSSRRQRWGSGLKARMSSL
jgi:integrase